MKPETPNQAPRGACQLLQAPAEANVKVLEHTHDARGLDLDRQPRGRRFGQRLADARRGTQLGQPRANVVGGLVEVAMAREGLVRLGAAEAEAEACLEGGGLGELRRGGAGLAAAAVTAAAAAAAAAAGALALLVDVGRQGAAEEARNGIGNALGAGAGAAGAAAAGGSERGNGSGRRAGARAELDGAV